METTNPEGERLQKIIASAGLASRRGAETLIKSGRVKVNGQIIKELGTRADPKTDVITVDNKEIKPVDFLTYFMFHKPVGYLTSMSDPKGRPTIKPFLEKLKPRVYPVGRLDMDVSGFLVLTNDGELARRLMHPSFMVPKIYRVLTQNRPGPEALSLLRSGQLIIGDKPTAPAKAEILTKGEDKGWLELTLTEGRHRQVKRMCSAVGHPVIKLKRVSYAGLWLDPNLPPGSIRKLTQKEINLLKKIVGLL
jgi:pseudouridine synthase